MCDGDVGDKVYVPVAGADAPSQYWMVWIVAVYWGGPGMLWSLSWYIAGPPQVVR